MANYFPTHRSSPGKKTKTKNNKNLNYAASDSPCKDLSNRFLCQKPEFLRYILKKRPSHRVFLGRGACSSVGQEGIEERVAVGFVKGYPCGEERKKERKKDRETPLLSERRFILVRRLY